MATPSGDWFQELVLKFEDGSQETVFLESTRSGSRRPLPVHHVSAPAPWTELPFHKCPGCPLPESERWCPAALSLEQTLLRLRGHRSYEPVTATAVDGENRATLVRWPLQQVGAVFVHLAVFSSGCPVGSRFKGFLKDLRPFSTTRELGRHLATKFLLRHTGEVQSSRDEILARLGPIQEVFTHLFRRLDGQTRGAGDDAIPNSIAHMHAVAQSLALKLDELVAEVLREARSTPRPNQAGGKRRARGFWERLAGLILKSDD